MIEPAGHDDPEPTTALGDAHLAASRDSIRVWAADVNRDGKLDLLLGDNVTLCHAVESVEPDVAKAKLAEWRAESEGGAARLRFTASAGGERHGLVPGAAYELLLEPRKKVDVLAPLQDARRV